ncbi:MAG: DUF2752 domain-containing protein [Planctomycetaceae bacterium]
MAHNSMQAETAEIVDVEVVDDRAERRALQQRRNHRFVLFVSVFALVISFLLEVVPHGRVAFRGFESMPLPHTCSARVLFGYGCPGCGLTRGYVHLAHGRWQASLAVHRLAWLLALATLLQVPYRLVAIYGNNPAPLGKTWPQVFGWTLVGLLLANWIYGLILVL